MTRAISNSDSDLSRSTLFTLVLWIICIAIGLVGFVFPYMRPKHPAPAPPPIQAELIKVELTDAAIPPEIIPQPANMPDPSAVQPLEIPKALPLIAVAEPSPAIAFALPVEGPARIVDMKSASSSKPAQQATAAPATQVQTLTFGSGVGKQPAPEYPTRAQREGQEGVVLVQFSVGENGRVISAETALPSPWPLLNKEAVRVIRDRWQFAPGGVRLYEIAIRFQLRK